MADGSSMIRGRRWSANKLEKEIDSLKCRLNDVVAQHGLRHAEVQSIMDRLDPLIAELMRRRLRETRK